MLHVAGTLRKLRLPAPLPKLGHILKIDDSLRKLRS
jgi:hypothetical protein